MQTFDPERVSGALHLFPEWIGAWLFGSAQNGILREGGDIDLGLLFEDCWEPDALLKISSAVVSALMIDRIDVVNLNTAGSILRFEALRGRELFCKDLNRKAEFFSLSCREYEDEMAFIKRAQRHRTIA